MSSSFTTEIVNNIPVHYQSTDKYKTNFIAVYFRQPLSEEHYTKVALIPSVLKRGTVHYPSAQKIRQALDDLYGATLSTDVVKRGEEQVVVFRLQFANEKYLKDATPLFEKGVALLSEILFNPLLENGAFQEKHVQLEKDLLDRKLARIKDDKVRYANKRCTEEMFANESYRLFAHGSREQIPHCTAQNLYAYYQEMVNRQPIECFVAGDVEAQQIRQTIQNYFQTGRGQNPTLPQTDVGHDVGEVQTVTEETDIAQGKLHIGCRTQTAYQDDDYIPLVVFNGLFGGFSHSKLFRNVREKESLAYYVSSSVESHKGFMMIASGIDFKNYDKTVQIIQQELQNVVDGQISEEEINQTKAMLINQLKEGNDQPFQSMERHFHGIVGGKTRTSQEAIESIEQVSKEDIQQVAQKVQMDTIYFLTQGQKDGEA